MLLYIVDDNQINLVLFEKLCGLLPAVSQGLEIHSFLDPFEALTACQNNLPDLLLVDYMMPGLDGLELVARFRRQPGAMDVPVVMITAAQDRDIRHRALAAGITDFLNKPVDPLELQPRLTNLLKLRQQHLRLKDRNQWLAEEVRKATRQLVDREMETIIRLTRAAEYRDPETGGHIQRMAHYTRLIAKALALPEEQCELLLRAAPMHDVGKLGIPDRILLKPGRLNDDEMVIMRTHAQIGHDLLHGSHSRLLQMGAEIALHHHEKFDGSGYPNGLKGEDIALSGRIVAVADVFDALTSARPYKPAWPLDRACQLLRDESGRHFDPRCVDAFFSVWDQVLDIRNQFQDDEDTPPMVELSVLKPA